MSEDTPPSARSLLRLAVACVVGFVAGIAACVGAVVLANRVGFASELSLGLGFGAFVTGTAVTVLAITKAGPQAAASAPTGPPFADVLATIRAPEVVAKPVGQWLFLALLIISVAANAHGSSLTSAVGLTLVVFIHEAGHWGAMRLFGYRDTRIFFVPFFGGAATGVKDHAPAWQESIVLLAGPVPGIAIGAAMVASNAAPKGSPAHSLALMFLSINAFNLLPLHPLDGGRLVQRTALSRWPVVEALGVAAMSLGMLGVAISVQSYLLGFLAAIGFAQVPRTVVYGVAALRLRAKSSERPEQLRDGSDEYVHALYDAAANGTVPSTAVAGRLNVMRLIHRCVLREPASALVSIAAIATQIAALAVVSASMSPRLPALMHFRSSTSTTSTATRAPSDSTPERPARAPRSPRRQSSDLPPESLAVVVALVIMIVVGPIAALTHHIAGALREKLVFLRNPSFEWIDEDALSDEEHAPFEARVAELIDAGCTFVGFARLHAMREMSMVLAVAIDDRTGSGVVVGRSTKDRLVHSSILAFARLDDGARVTTGNQTPSPFAFPGDPGNAGYALPRLTSGDALIEAHRALADHFRGKRAFVRLNRDTVLEDDLRASLDSRARHLAAGLYDVISSECVTLSAKGARRIAIRAIEPFRSANAGWREWRSEATLRAAITAQRQRSG